MAEDSSNSALPAGKSHMSLKSTAYRAALKTYTHIGARFTPRRMPYMPGMPVRVEGFHGEILGIGETARQFARAMMQAGHDTRPWSIDPRLRPAGPATADRTETALRVSHLNPDQLLEFSMRIASAGERRMPHAGYWVWELGRAPKHWRRAAGLVDAVWTPSRFSADAITQILPEGRVAEVLPPPIFASGPAEAPPGLPGQAEAVRVLALCDLRSSAARKNPLGALAAFETASASASRPAHLVLKVTGSAQCAGEMARLAARIGDRPDVTLLVKDLTDAQMLGLIEACPIALSLHRSEGFGLLAAHAAYRGKAVIATNWSAPTEFLTAEGAGLVNYRLVPVEDAQGIYPDGQSWAEPDIDHAADWLVRLIDKPELRSRMGEIARRHADARLGPAAWQACLASRLDGLARAHRDL